MPQSGSGVKDPQPSSAQQQSYQQLYQQYQYKPEQFQQHQQSYIHTYSPIDQNGYNPNTFSSYSIQQTPRKYQDQHRALSSNQVSQITGQKIREGSVIKGRSRIEYVPFQKKITQYEIRTYKQMIPKTRKVIQYEQRKYIENVPREVIKQQYIAVERVTQYIKQVIPEKKIQHVPVQRKVKKIQYVPVEKQIVHYPKDEQFINVQGQSRVVLQSQGVQVRPDAEYKPIESDLLYKFTNNTTNPNIPVGYVDLGSRRFLSTAPTNSTTNLGYSNVVQTVSRQDLGGMNPFQIQGSQIVYDTGKSFINDLNLNTGEFKGNYINENNNAYNKVYSNQQHQYNTNQYQHQQNRNIHNNGSTTRSINEH